MLKHTLYLRLVLDLVFSLQSALVAATPSQVQTDYTALKIKKRSIIGKNIQEGYAFW
jgi:hypothetical protein